MENYYQENIEGEEIKIEPLGIGINVTGTHWDATAIRGINDVAKALLNLTEIYKSQNLTVNISNCTIIGGSK